MTPIFDMIGLLQSHLSPVAIYQDVVPEGVEETACAVSFLALEEDRVLEGGVVGEMNSFRVAVVGQNDFDVKSVVEDLESLDNTKTSNFGRIFARLSNWEARDSNQPYRRAFVDVRVYQ